MLSDIINKMEDLEGMEEGNWGQERVLE